MVTAKNTHTHATTCRSDVAARVREHTPPNERTGLPETPAPNS